MRWEEFMILLLDLDSTLVAEEGCNTLAQWKWVWDQVARITQQTMDGTMDFNTAFPQKLELIRPSYQDLDKIWWFLLDYLTDEWKQVIAQLQDEWVRVGILSQWYVRSSLPIAQVLNIPPEWVFALHFHHTEDGTYQSLDMTQDLMYYDGKRRIIEKLRESYPNEKIVFSWDSLWDYESGQIADLFVAYAGVVARPKVVAIAGHIAYSPQELYDYIETLF